MVTVTSNPAKAKRWLHKTLLHWYHEHWYHEEAQQHSTHDGWERLKSLMKKE
ncbi:hypothetical protein A2U01_0082522, partial [Trifolium medium]|nr:hypothetical protein [Trifolium medium]